MTENTTTAAPAATSYVHTVPDHCDRVVWRGRYLSLPLQAAPAAQEAEPSGEHYEELLATLQGLHTFCENVSCMERRIGPLGSHARGYTHKITAAIRHLNAMAARRPKADAGAPPLTPDEARWAARSADRMRGPSDVTSGTEYAMAGAIALAKKLAATPQAPAAAVAPAAGEMLEALQLVASKLESRPYGTGSYIPKPIREKVHAAIANYLQTAAAVVPAAAPTQEADAAKEFDDWFYRQRIAEASDVMPSDETKMRGAWYAARARQEGAQHER